MKEFKAKTVNVVVPVSINAPVEEIFPLPCPIEEYRWIPGWKSVLQHCPNEKVELGTIFDEIFTAPFLMGNAKGITTWTAVEYDPENYNIHYKLVNENSSSYYKIEFEDDGKGGTVGKLDLAYTATTKKGNRMIEKGLEEKIEIMLTMLHTWLAYYAENKELIPVAEAKKAVPMEKLSVVDKIRLLRNRSARNKMIDKNRERYMKMWAIEQK